jgi:glycogen debranching enzyme
MRTCSVCGGKSPDEAKHCMHCGAAFVGDDQEGAPENIPGGQESTEVEWLQVLEGSTFMLSDHRGDVMGGSIAGLFHEDTRHLSRFVLRISGERPAVLTSNSLDHFSAAFFMTNNELPEIPPHTMSIQRYRSIGQGLTEVIVVTNHRDEPATLQVRLTCGADFADLFEVKDMRMRKRGAFTVTPDDGASTITYAYTHGDFTAKTRIHSTEDAAVDGEDFIWDLELGPRSTWKTKIQVTVGQGEEELQPITPEDRAASMALQQWRGSSAALERWQAEVPVLDAGWDLLKLVYQRSTQDLAALRLSADVEGNEYALPAAGLPWFMAIFGRDTLITSYMSLLVGPELARGALYALSGLQGKEVNDFKDEEPGKILHEIRFGELTVLGERPHRPYYGTADATPLFLVLFSEYWRLTHDMVTAIELRENALRALEWCDRHGDRDGDGYVEYDTRSEQGLGNQGWKDSWDGVMFRDGRLPDRPIAMAEIQGYVYDAKMRIAEVAEEAWQDPELGARLRSEAKTLFDRFNEDFWVQDRGGYYAMALDGEKRPVDAMTSNMGHLLWSGIVPEERATIVADQLFSDAMWTGWGIRTMSTDDAGYNPISYHDGTVWPHDNCVVSAGLYRYGMRDRANRVALALLEAAAFTDYRLPEVFAGYPRTDSRFPVRYPTASSPQAWATASPFLWLRIMLGIEPDGGKLAVSPDVPKQCGKISLKGVHAFGQRWDVVGEGRMGGLGPAGSAG